MFIRMSIFALLLCLALVIGALSWSKGAQERESEQRSEEGVGIKLKASVPKEHFRVGEPIVLKLILKNDSSEELPLVSTGLKDYKLDVRNEQGKLRPLTAAGEALKRTDSLSISKGRIALAPGEEHEEGEISVTERFKLTEPGKYVIVVKRPGLLRGGKLQTIESNKLTVAIE
jgi:hypothetical protein